MTTSISTFRYEGGKHTLILRDGIVWRPDQHCVFRCICWCRLLQQRLDRWNRRLVLATNSDNFVVNVHLGERVRRAVRIRKEEQVLHEVKVCQPLCAYHFLRCLLTYHFPPPTRTSQRHRSRPGGCGRSVGNGTAAGRGDRLSLAAHWSRTRLLIRSNGSLRTDPSRRFCFLLSLLLLTCSRTALHKTKHLIIGKR